MSDGSGIERAAQDAHEAIRRINHDTIFASDGIPAPVVYRALSFLQSAGGYGLAQALDQLGRGLQRSLTTHDVYEDDGREPAESVAQAVGAMNEAIALVERVGPLLDMAQAAIARQGYRPTTVGGLETWEVVPAPTDPALRAGRAPACTTDHLRPYVADAEREPKMTPHRGLAAAGSSALFHPPAGRFTRADYAQFRSADSIPLICTDKAIHSAGPRGLILIAHRRRMRPPSTGSGALADGPHRLDVPAGEDRRLSPGRRARGPRSTRVAQPYRGHFERTHHG